MEKEIRIAVCDDESIFGKYISQIIEKYFNRKKIPIKIDIYLSGEEFTARKNQMRLYDIVFMDVDMKEMNGLMAAEQLRLESENALLIFVTAYITYALEGYKVKALRYILKEKEHLEESIYEALDLCCRELKVEKRTLELKVKEGKEKFILENIVYLESHLHDVDIYYNDEKIHKYRIRETLNNLEEQISDKKFCRIHQSILVNMKYVKSMKSMQVVLKNDMILPIAKSRYPQVRKLFSLYKGDIK